MLDGPRRQSFVLSLAFILSCVAAAESNAREVIEKHYLKATEATKLRYYDGCVSMRHPDFEAYAPDGARANLSLDRQSLRHIFATAVTVEEKMQILSFRQLTPNKVVCEVQDSLEFVVVASVLKDAQVNKLETRSTDTWVKTPTGWRLRTTRLSKQSHSQHPLGATATPTAPASSRPDSGEK